VTTGARVVFLHSDVGDARMWTAQNVSSAASRVPAAVRSTGRARVATQELGQPLGDGLGTLYL
jgi:hypothetical protein